MTDDQAREALLELAQELDRMRALVEALARRLHVFTDEEFDDMRARS